MNFPPTKRLRGLNHEVATGVPFDDPFADDEDFTQDDLDEIDIIASQAITSANAGTGPGSKSVQPGCGTAWVPPVAHSKLLSRSTTNQSREKTFEFKSSTRGHAGISGNRQQQFGFDGNDASLLEVQHAELKRKLREVEEEILLKNGEIRVLRDSLKAAQQEKEAQKQNQILLETQRHKEQSEMEKELNKKVQSLQSELQFKEAEINEMKTKLINSDRNKIGSPLPRNSPKILSNLAQLHHGSGSSSSSPTGNGFITKEVFGAQTMSRTTPVKTQTRKDNKGTSKSGDRQEVSRPDPFLSVRPLHLPHQGGVLLGLLLQQPLSPSKLSLSHLLAMSPTDLHLTSRGLPSGFLLHSDAATSLSDIDGRAAQSPVQSLAVTGLNMLSLSQTTAAGNSGNRSCPGAVLLLPLLNLHLFQLCQALDSLRTTSANSNSSSDSTAASFIPAACPAPTAGSKRPEETGVTGFRVEDTGLAALRLLYLMLSHSDEVVEAVLDESQSRVTKNKTTHSAADIPLCSQNSLLQSLLKLCESGCSSHREDIVLNAMKTLCVLIERTPQTQANRLQCALQVVCACLSADIRFRTVSECVSILTVMCDHQTLAQYLCTQHDPCVLLKLFHFIRTRPDIQATHTDLILLDLQLVRLLSRLMSQTAERWTNNSHSSCQCYTELVQIVVIVFHRQWLHLRGVQELTDSVGPDPTPSHSSVPTLPWLCGPAACLLRECLLLMHWLLLHHGSFSESCRPLLHMYDQVIPAVRDTLRKVPDLSESEELALEEICRSEGDDTDDMDTDTVS
ncbi:ATR-interacting protein isoform X2 [Betta splendens]|uniref:ATR-interacting protein isoform X2 n=1 Tax=Betta splendens TaxID=158456 RepID=A0A6P7MI79_BETSP|nr:ATR-interacting protein isoform X2 [Betta splendens]